ncbi:MAG TPA: protealysin inhibitor emfourin [Methylibium sp.]|uniref:protealysin inhibitor emfourin n=1 Tax=Methylibium sp. TaxID=2067992 RepID=UPI002DB90F14|nr:protealysin inhibitor emfourin [Methylibium sp.]HEU4460926.1 protealysin inhibitor emfourin [Methylibium sp.]
MDEIEIERLGGFAGFGGPGAHLRSRGCVVWTELSLSEQRACQVLFAHPPEDATPAPDGFRYRLTWRSTHREQTIEAPEHDVPSALRKAVKDELV